MLVVEGSEQRIIFWIFARFSVFCHIVGRFNLYYNLYQQPIFPTIYSHHWQFLISEEQQLSPQSSKGEILTNEFKITLSADEWVQIAPKEYTYKRNSIIDPNKVYKVLTPNVWTHIINEHFWLMTKLSCCIVYKRANVTEYGQHYVRFVGTCKNCEGKFTGTMTSPPPEGQRYIFLNNL